MGLYSDFFYSSQVNSIFSEQNTLAYMLKVEAALAQSQAETGIISKEVAATISSCCVPESIDLNALKRDINLGGNAAIPLVQQLTKRVKSIDFEASKYVHLGVTSQDIIDTATVLQIRDFLDLLEKNIDVLLEELAKKTQKFKASFMVGRTLLQHARPITFGLKTGFWLESIQRSKSRIIESSPRLCVIQLAGAVGTQNTHLTSEVCNSLANILNLNYANSWHSSRDNLSELASKLGILVGSLSKIAKDVSILMQTEISEVFEGAAEGKGGSSTMPHKRNPVTCAAIIANGVRVPHLVATMLSTMSQENERSAGMWHAEWESLSEIMLLTAGSLERSVELITDLEIDEKRMLQNLELTQGLIYAENVSLALAPLLGKTQAHELIEKACKTAISKNKNLKDVLKEMPNIQIENFEDLFKPENAIGNSIEIVESILKQYKNEL